MSTLINPEIVINLEDILHSTVVEYTDSTCSAHEALRDGEDTFDYLCDCLGLEPEVVARDIEELRAYLDDSEPAPEWIGKLSREELSDLLDVYYELT